MKNSCKKTNKQTSNKIQQNPPYKQKNPQTNQPKIFHKNKPQKISHENKLPR